MANTTLDADGIGPQLSLDDLALESPVGERLGTLLRHEGSIETAAEWVAVLRRALADDAGRAPTVEDLCTTDDGAHTFEGDGGSQSYICVLDPLAYPFLTDTPGTVRSETPVRGETVEVEARADGATLSHDDAVVSLGVADAVDGSETVTPEVIYRQVCGFIHVFADRQEYEKWAEDVDAATMAVPATEGVALAGGLAMELFD